MTTVYLLWHVHRVEDDEDEKLVGVYSTPERATEAVARLAIQPGFKDLPEVITDDDDDRGGGFLIVSYLVDEDQWIEGYTSD